MLKASPVEAVCGWDEKRLEKVLLIHSGQRRSSTQSEWEHDGGVHGNTTGTGTMHNSLGNRFISYLSECAFASMKPIYTHAGVICRLISPGTKKTEAIVNNQNLFFCLIYMWETHRARTKMSLLSDSFRLTPPVWLDSNTLLIRSVLVLWFGNRSHARRLWELSDHIFGTCRVHGLPVGFSWRHRHCLSQIKITTNVSFTFNWGMI